METNSRREGGLSEANKYNINFKVKAQLMLSTQEGLNWVSSQRESKKM